MEVRIATRSVERYATSTERDHKINPVETKLSPLHIVNTATNQPTNFIIIICLYTMRLYNAQSCTPMGTTRLNVTPSFPTQTFLPSPRRRQRTFRVQRKDMNRAIAERSRQRRDDAETQRDSRNKSLERETLLPDSNKGAETKSFVDDKSDQPVGSCFLLFPRKKPSTTAKARKRNSAFHSPLRIAKYSFQSPQPRSPRAESTDSPLDLVFSSSENSPLISKNETGTTAAASDLEQTPTDASPSNSFHIDIEVLKTDSDIPSDIPAKLLMNGSPRSKSSESTLTTNFAVRPILEGDAPIPFDEVEANKTDNRTLFSPIPWQSKKPAFGKKVQVPTKQVIQVDDVKHGFVQKKINLFQNAWLPDKFDLSDGFSEDESWIDFTNDPFMSHPSVALERPFPAKVDTAVTPTSSKVVEETADTADFVVKKSDETRTMENFVHNIQTNSAVSVVSFPSLSVGGHTWSQVGSIDERDDEESSVFFESLRRPASKAVAKPVISTQTKPNLGSVLQARYAANRITNKAKQNSQTLQPNPKVASALILLHDAKRGDATAKEYITDASAVVPKGVNRDEKSTEAPSSKRSKEGVRHFCLHWESHDEVGPNTLWSKVYRDSTWLNDTLLVDENEFSQLFAQKKIALGSFRAKKEVSSSARVLEPNRAIHGEIALSQIEFKYDLVAQAIDKLDTSLLSSEQMKAIIPFLPSVEESTLLQRSMRRATTSDWFQCECEKFMISMLHVPGAEEKLQHMIFMKTFFATVEELRMGE